MSDNRTWTDAEHRAAREGLRTYLADVDWLPHAVAAVLTAVAPLIADRATRAERNRIVRALRNLPCPDGERPGARITADEHQRWLTDVIGAVNTTEGADHAI